MAPPIMAAPAGSLAKPAHLSPPAAGSLAAAVALDALVGGVKAAAAAARADRRARESAAIIAAASTLTALAALLRVPVTCGSGACVAGRLQEEKEPGSLRTRRRGGRRHRGHALANPLSAAGSCTGTHSGASDDSLEDSRSSEGSHRNLAEAPRASLRQLEAAAEASARRAFLQLLAPGAGDAGACGAVGNERPDDLGEAALVPPPGGHCCSRGRRA